MNLFQLKNINNKLNSINCQNYFLSLKLFTKKLNK